MTTTTANPSTAFFPNDRNTANTLHTPAPTSRWRSFYLRLWFFFSWFRRFSVRYAFKATIAALILATPAFVNAWQDWFLEYRMEWGLITVGSVDESAVVDFSVERFTTVQSINN